ncbi:hypothetical protein E2C01_001216 [Portunus trituberculatus]|uniref:Uncharacterized protein n=1 Tax=Portunus trituberculatus TaxID=210409 RepID=A0A5B7CH97_PORTR|nr:hypothetical protein [Portunus trituberculatus]
MSAARRWQGSLLHSAVGHKGHGSGQHGSRQHQHLKLKVKRRTLVVSSAPPFKTLLASLATTLATVPRREEHSYWAAHPPQAPHRICGSLLISQYHKVTALLSGVALTRLRQVPPSAAVWGSALRAKGSKVSFLRHAALGILVGGRGGVGSGIMSHDVTFIKHRHRCSAYHFHGEPLRGSQGKET